MDGSPMIVPCILALVKWSVLAQALQDPQPPTWFADKDDPVYKLERPKYVRDMNKSIESDYYRCVHADVFRLKFGKEVGKRDVKSVAVPILWPEFTVSAKIVITSIGSFLPNMTKVWPEIIMPFLFTLMSVACAILLILPILLMGGICWALIYNLRFIGHRKIRLAIRSLLIKKENWRRWYYEHCFPPQHLRKFRERDRYQMPEVFQHPDLTSDDEPEELQRLHILRQKTTMWTKKEIEMLGFDPDNIAMEKIYGDLLGTPDELAPEVRDYIKDKKVVSDDVDNASITSDEWVQALRSRVEEIQEQSNDSMLRSFWSRINTDASQLFNTPVFKSRKDSKMSKGSSGSSDQSDDLSRQKIVTNKIVSKPKTNDKPPGRPSIKVSRLTGRKRNERNLSVRDISAQPMPSAPKFWVSKKATPVKKFSQTPSTLGRLNPTYAGPVLTRVPSPVKLNPSKILSDSNSPTQGKVDTEEPKQRPPIKHKHWHELMRLKPHAPVETKPEEGSKPKTDARLASGVDNNASNRQVRSSVPNPNQQVQTSTPNDPNSQVQSPAATGDPDFNSKDEKKNSFPKTDPNQSRKDENRTSGPKEDHKRDVVDNTIFTPKHDPVLRQDQDNRKSQPQDGVNPKRDDDKMQPREAPEQPQHRNTYVPKDGPNSSQNPNLTLPRSPLLYRAGKKLSEGPRSPNIEKM